MGGRLMPPTIDVLGTIIRLDVPLPGDVVVGDWVEIKCERLDL